MSVVIVTDSAAALPVELAREHGIEVVPMLITADGRSYRDGELPVDAVLGAREIETSGPSPGDFVESINARMGPEGVLVLTLSRNMSSTHEAAVIAARLVDGPVRVVDTQNAAGAEALVALAAARSAATGASLEEVAQVAEAVIARVRLVATLPDLAYLAKSGRVPGLAHQVGRRLRVAPLFEFVSGAVRPHRPALGVEAAYDRMVHLVLRGRAAGAALHVAAYHALAPEAAAELLARVQQEVTPASAFVGHFGSVMVAHTGPGLVGLAWWWDDRADAR